MASIEKKAKRDRRARAYRDFVRSLASISQMTHKATASSIFDSLSRARLSERHAASSRLARETLFEEDPGANVPEELSDKVISRYLADAGLVYGGAATDYLLVLDLVRAFKYFRKAAQHCTAAAELATEEGPALLEKSREYKGKANMVRQELAKKSVLRRRWSLGFLARIR